MILTMESVEYSPPLRLLRSGTAAFLTLIAAGCLTLFYVQEAWFVRILRIVVELGLPWIVARLLPGRLSLRSYRFRLGVSYLLLLVIGVIVILILPFVELFLMDAGLA